MAWEGRGWYNMMIWYEKAWSDAVWYGMGK